MKSKLGISDKVFRLQDYKFNVVYRSDAGNKYVLYNTQATKVAFSSIELAIIDLQFDSYSDLIQMVYNPNSAITYSTTRGKETTKL